MLKAGIAGHLVTVADIAQRQILTEMLTEASVRMAAPVYAIPQQIALPEANEAAAPPPGTEGEVEDPDESDDSDEEPAGGAPDV